MCQYQQARIRELNNEAREDSEQKSIVNIIQGRKEIQRLGDNKKKINKVIYNY